MDIVASNTHQTPTFQSNPRSSAETDGVVEHGFSAAPAPRFNAKGRKGKSKVYLRRLAEAIASVPELRSEEEFRAYLATVEEETALIAIIRGENYEGYLQGRDTPGESFDTLVAIKTWGRGGGVARRGAQKEAKKNKDASAEAASVTRASGWYRGGVKQGMEEPIILTTGLLEDEAGIKELEEAALNKYYSLCYSTRWRGENGVTWQDEFCVSGHGRIKDRVLCLRLSATSAYVIAVGYFPNRHDEYEAWLKKEKENCTRIALSTCYRPGLDQTLVLRADPGGAIIATEIVNEEDEDTGD